MREAHVFIINFVYRKDEEMKSLGGVGGLKIELNVKQKQEIKEAFVACDLKGTGYMDVGDLKVYYTFCIKSMNNFLNTCMFFQ